MSEVKIRTSGENVFSTVASSATSVTIVAANARRKTLIIQNTSSAILYLYLSTSAATATTAHSVQLAANAYIVLEGYTGAATGIWASANGQANISELV